MNRIQRAYLLAVYAFFIWPFALLKKKPTSTPELIMGGCSAWIFILIIAAIIVGICGLIFGY